MKKRFWLWLAAIALCCVSAFAHNTPDLSREGSIHVTMAREGETVPGGTLTLYRAGDMLENHTFRLTEDFAESGTELGPLNAALAQTLKNYADAQALTGRSEHISPEGDAVFSGLKAGLYLLVQEEAAEGYYRTEPFLVTLPMEENGEYVYDVKASPKVEEKPSRPDRPSPPNEPDAPVESPRTEEPQSPPKDPEEFKEPTTEILETPPPLTPGLPQTGQLNWPVPVLAVLGMALLALGIFVKRSGYEK